MYLSLPLLAAGVKDMYPRPYVIDHVIRVPEPNFVFKLGKDIEGKLMATFDIVGRW